MEVVQKKLLFVIFLTLLISGHAQDVVGSLNSSFFLQPPMPPRIYAQAPSGVVVTKVILPKYSKRNIQDLSIKPGSKLMSSSESRTNFQNPDEMGRGRIGAPCVPQYFLYQNHWTDYERFAIDRCSGAISTSKYVDKSVGHTYKIIVIATDHQNATIATKEIKIEVSSYNSKPPKLSLSHYTTEILDTSSPGTLVITPVSSDNDTDPLNRELYFSLQSPSIPNNPWFQAVTTPLIMNVTSGEIRVSEPLVNCSSPLHFRVLVSDAGSPPRSDSARLTVHIRNMTAPRNVKILNITKSSMKVCWSPPLHGTPEGYFVTYKSQGSGSNTKGSADGGKLNLTIDELETRTDDPSLNIPKISEGFPEYNSTKQTDLEVQEELYSFFAHQFCTRVDGLTALTNYAVSVRAWASNGRISMARMPLTAITWRKNCNDVVCENGICQEKTASPGFTCYCTAGFYGPYCQFEDPCIKRRGNFTCQNGGTCVRNTFSNGENEPICDCPFEYFGPQCQYINPCATAGNRCLNQGVCVPINERTFSCRCPNYAKGERCEIKSGPRAEFSCKEEKTESAEGTFNWPLTTIGEIAYHPCPFGVREVHVELSPLGESNNDVYTISNHSNSNSLRRSTRSYLRAEDEIELLQRYKRSADKMEMAFRKCGENESGNISWFDPRLSVCKTNEEEAQNIINITSTISRLNSTTLASSVKKISNLVAGAIHDKKMAQTMITALSNILNVDKELLERTEDASSSILSTLDEYTSKVHLKFGEKIKLRSKNLNLEAQRIYKDDLPDEVSFNPFTPEEGNEENSETEKQDTLWFKMPKESLLQLSDLNSQNDVSSDSNNDLRLQFVSFNDDILFRRRDNKERLNKPVIRASVEHRTVQNLRTPVTFKIPIGLIDPFLKKPICVFWDEEKQDWSTDGVETKQTENGETICESHHLTSFSVLLDPIGSPIMTDIKPVLSVITYIGIALSTVALVATIVTFAIFSFNRDRSGLIVMNLSIALLVMNISFLIAHFITSDQTGCWIFGALLHYAVTASFAWMLIEAVNMYQLLVTVFPSAETHFMRKRVIVGWVSPFVLVFIALVWNKNVYFTEHQAICVISPITAPAVYYTTYLVPVCIVLLINISVFLLVARVLCQSRPTYTRKVPVTLAQIRGAIAIVALLGITWLTGVIAVGPLRMVSQILFCFTTPFQGLIIFWVRVMQSADARMAWKTFLKTGSTRKRPQPLSSLRTHSSSHQASSFHTQSTGTTPPKSVYETALKTVRRLSSSGLGFIGSAKKFRSSTSSDGSTKRLNKKLSIDSEKNKKIISNDNNPTGDNLICQLNQGLNNENNFRVFKNNDPKVLSQESYQNKINQEHRSSEKSSSRNDEEPMKELHLILDIKFDKMRPQPTHNDTERQTQEYIFSYLKSSRLENRALNCDNPKQMSYSTSNLSPVKTKDGKEECARSLESLLPTIGKNYLKTRTPMYDNSVNDSKWKSPSESSSNRTSSRRKLNQTDSVGNGSYNESVTKSASDSDLNELTISSEMGSKTNPKINLGLEESDYESPTMPEITLSSDPTMAFTLSHRTSSELMLGPRTSDSSFIRRSASISDLEFMDHYVPYQNFSSKGYL